MVIRRFGVWSVARLAAILYGGLGFIIGAIIALISLIAAGAASAFRTADTPLSSFAPAFFGVGAVIVLPIFYAVIGVVFGALTAALYNVAAGFVGGVQIETE